MKKLEKLTPEQELKMQEVKAFWLNYINSCENSIDRNKAKIGIDQLYNSIGKESPIIIYLDSPMSCQIGVNYLREILKTIGLKKSLAQVGDQVGDQVRAQVRDQVGDQVRDQVGDQVRAQVRDQVWAQVGDQVWAQVRAQVGDQVWAQVGDQVWAQVRAQVGDQVRAQVRAQVWAQVGDQVGDQVGAQVGDQKLKFENFSEHGSIYDYYWVSFYDFFTQVGIIDHKGFNQFKELLLSGIYDMIQLDGFCIVSELPKELKRNELKQLHSLDSPAITFPDGYSQYYVNGRTLTEKYFNSISNKTFTIEDFINESNEEYKSTCIAFMQEKHGDEYLVNFFRKYLNEVDTYVDKKEEQYLEGTTKGMNVGVYTLFKGQINGEDIAYVRCYCPSTDRMFFLGVQSVYNNAKDAIASLYRIPRKLSAEIKYIQRQGERYSTIFTENGKNILKKLNDNEISDLVNLTGNEYFSKIKFEY